MQMIIIIVITASLLPLFSFTFLSALANQRGEQSGWIVFFLVASFMVNKEKPIIAACTCKSKQIEWPEERSVLQGEAS